MNSSYKPEFSRLLSVLEERGKQIPETLFESIQKFNESAKELQTANSNEVKSWLPVLKQTDAAISAWLIKEFRKHGLQPPSETKADDDRLKLLKLRAKAINLRTKQSA